MTAIEIDGRRYVPEGPLRRGLRAALAGAGGTVGRAVAGAATALRARSRPAADQVKEHAYSIAGFCFIDSACFTHSVFTGLMVTGISFFLFEWKVSE